jgi:hypothetical protein
MTKEDKENITLTVLVMPYEGEYMAMCRETGLIRSGSTLGEAKRAIESSTSVLFEAVAKDDALRRSLFVGLPIKYRILFDWTVVKIFLRLAVRDMLYQKTPSYQLCAA